MNCQFPKNDQGFYWYVGQPIWTFSHTVPLKVLDTKTPPTIQCLIILYIVHPKCTYKYTEESACIDNYTSPVLYSESEQWIHVLSLFLAWEELLWIQWQEVRAVYRSSEHKCCQGEWLGQYCAPVWTQDYQNGEQQTQLGKVLWK